jgi:FtsH-binding integral membrane protein
MNSDVFKRTHSNAAELGPSMYNLVIGLTLAWGFAINWYMVKTIDPQWLASINFVVFLLAYFALCFLGVYLFNSSENPLVSFAGYNLVVIPFGLVINIVVSQYDPTLVVEAIRVTALVTFSMMVLGSIFPAFFQKIVGALTVALLLVIVVELVEIFIFGIHHGIIDWIVVLIFCGYIGYDWGRANAIPKTLDNAIDSAAALYMDIINLFIRILRIMGRR